MSARPRQCCRNGLDLIAQWIVIAAEPMARKPIRKCQARRGVVPPRPVPEGFCAHWRGAHGGKRWLGFGTQIENGNGGQQLRDLLARHVAREKPPVCYPR